jgi:hypothetical protein
LGIFLKCSNDRAISARSASSTTDLLFCAWNLAGRSRKKASFIQQLDLDMPSPFPELV